LLKNDDFERRFRKACLGDKQAAEELDSRIWRDPQGLMPAHFIGVIGTTEGVAEKVSI
jgi:hypothetical protein